MDRFIAFVVGTLLGFLVGHFEGRQDIEPEVHVAAPAVTLDFASVVHRDVVIDPDTGVPIALPDGSSVDAARFRQDCEAVCTSDRLGFADDEPPRTLYVDPAHLICACFRHGMVVRYVGWERR